MNRDESTKRTAWLSVRVTSAEKELLTELASAEGMSMGDYLRHQLKQPRVRKTKSERQKILQLARIGNNLNQIARWANIYKGRAEAMQLLLQLAQIEEELRCL